MRFRGMLLAAVASLALSGCLVVDMVKFQQAQSGIVPKVDGPLPVSLPITDRGGLIGLSVDVAGPGGQVAQVPFVLDTGAPVTVLINSPEIEGLNLDLSKAQKLGDRPSSPVGSLLFGYTLDLGPVALEQTPVVGVPFETMPCPERFDAAGFRGVLGGDLLRRFVVELDFDAGRATLHDPATWRASDGDTVLPLSFDDGHIFVSGLVDLPGHTGLPLVFHVDSGQTSALNLVAGSRPEITLPTEGEVRTACLVNGTVEQRIGPPLAVTLGGRVAEGVRPLYGTDSQVEGGNHGAIGAPVLRRFNVVLDYPGKRLVLRSRAGT